MKSANLTQGGAQIKSYSAAVLCAHLVAFDLYTKSRGKRLFPLIGIGGSIGAWVGARAASTIVKGSDLIL